MQLSFVTDEDLFEAWGPIWFKRDLSGNYCASKMLSTLPSEGGAGGGDTKHTHAQWLNSNTSYHTSSSKVNLSPSFLINKMATPRRPTSFNSRDV